ncbi:MAG: nicotinate-nucleotide adenylyltransferase [Verrucomicrobia bacterium]|nr:nicotinate-nucleotide adenylyltransferase [Verrucomicrobiota bacterium]
MKQRIGIFGGSFNPVHNGHLIIAQDALDHFELDQVLFIPSAVPPHKTNTELIDESHRVAMLERAIEGDPRFQVNAVELDRGGTSYSIDTVKALQAIYPGDELFFIIGGDSLLELHTWKDIDELISLCEFIILARPGSQIQDLDPEVLKLPAEAVGRLLGNIAMGHVVEISSSDVRMRVAEGLSIRYLVPDAVEMYIYEHRLYHM